MKTKSLTFLLALTFLFLFSGSSVVFSDDFQDATDSGVCNTKDYGYEMTSSGGGVYWRHLLFSFTALAYDTILAILSNWEDAFIVVINN